MHKAPVLCHWHFAPISSKVMGVKAAVELMEIFAPHRYAQLQLAWARHAQLRIAWARHAQLQKAWAKERYDIRIHVAELAEHARTKLDP